MPECLHPPQDKVCTDSPFLSSPSWIETKLTTPRNESYQLSNASALKFSFFSSLGGGGGIRSTIASRTDSTPQPVLALMRKISDGSQPRRSDSSSTAASPRPSSLTRSHLLTADGGDEELGTSGLHSSRPDHVSLWKRTGTDDSQSPTERFIENAEGLRLDPLSRVDEEDGALARQEGPEQLARKVDVAGRVDQVEEVRLGAVVVIHHGGRLGANLESREWRQTQMMSLVGVDLSPAAKEDFLTVMPRSRSTLRVSNTCSFLASSAASLFGSGAAGRLMVPVISSMRSESVPAGYIDSGFSRPGGGVFSRGCVADYALFPLSMWARTPKLRMRSGGNSPSRGSGCCCGFWRLGVDVENVLDA